MVANVGRINVDYAHVESGEFRDTVYCPCQDTFLFVDALQSDIEHLCRREIAVVMEIGSGSGYISAYLLKLLRDNRRGTACRSTHRRDNGSSQCTEASSDATEGNCGSSYESGSPFVIAVDINPFANAATMKTFQNNGVADKADAIGMDMFASLNSRISKKMVDIVMFNPPYVPSDSTDPTNQCLDMAWNGGAMGSEVTDRFIASVKEYLSQHGTVYLLVEKRNDVNSVLQSIEKQGFHAEVGFKASHNAYHMRQVIITRKLLWETLSVIRFCMRENADVTAIQRQ
ncbi:hemK methyltransferase family member 2-like protein, putative [Babesia ovata]|uniref:HemK methyltransferase family member 2-like protein, putative n=1 Tax=Babesia ovata TaxID=189622 RepID=A0A2H6KEP4_9APIC|nr:hemK methyltransferase family member 2-like protein, putative [Babesia ovata]GBE61468.1 hemK methyltransferase family member 2-like protein, putative [Babesia ovata]